jgi:hypothetical protein
MANIVPFLVPQSSSNANAASSHSLKGIRLDSLGASLVSTNHLKVFISSDDGILVVIKRSSQLELKLHHQER